MSEDKLRTLYASLDDVRAYLESVKEWLAQNFRALIEQGSVLGLHIREEGKDYEVKLVCNPKDVLCATGNYKYIVCKEDTPKISYIEDEGLTYGATVVLESGERLDFNACNGYFMEGSSLDVMMCKEEVTYVLDILIGGYHRDSEGNID